LFWPETKILNRGEQQVHEVLSALKKLNDSEILKIISPFIPAPLLDKAIGLEYLHWLENLSGDEFNVYFAKQ
jgi:hypothetical protein